MKFGIIGFGNLGSAFATGLIKQDFPQDNILVCDYLESSAKKARQLAINTASFELMLEYCDIIVLAIKRPAFDKVDINPDKFVGKTVLSFMGNVSYKTLKETFKCDVVRAMPTIAMENNQSVTGVYWGETDINPHILSVLKDLGLVINCETEDKLQSMTALASSGLGFAAYILNCFVKSGENIGFTEQEAIRIVSQTFSGAIELGNFYKVLNQVASPGGITQKGIEYMDDGNIEKRIDGAIKDTYSRAVKDTK